MALNLHNPYRYFFPLSLAGAISGLSLFLFGYSGAGILWHREVMITLFILPAASGFLFTAAPRFLMADTTSKLEFRISIILLMALFFCFFSQSITWFLILKSLYLLHLLIYMVRRWWKKANRNPYWPPFILTSLATGLIASFQQVFHEFFTTSPILLSLAQSLYYDAMGWILLFGIGVKFFPMLTGAVPPVYSVSKKTLLKKEWYESEKLWFGVAFLSLSSFIIQSLLNPALGLWLRALILLFISYEGWSVFAKPQRTGFTTSFLRIVLITIVAAHLLFPFFLSSLVHFYHLVFVGGFLSVTIAVETRVVLAHENLDLQQEQKSYGLLTAYMLFYFAMIARVTALWVPDHYASHLAYASFTAVLGLVIMIGVILSQLRKTPKISIGIKH